MAKETLSEKMVKIACRKYERNGKLQVSKVDPGMRFTKQGAIFEQSRGLDFSGLMSCGKHIEFEVKETRKNLMPVGDIRESQLQKLEDLRRMNAETFLLIYFSARKEWYRVEPRDLINVIDMGHRSIPIAYLRAFGFLIPCDNGYPEFLSPESHPYCNTLKSSYPSWMPKIRKAKEVAQTPKINHLDSDARKKRILNAMDRGIKNAKRKKEQTKIFIYQARQEKQYGPKGAGS